MSKIMIIPSSLEQIKKTIEEADAILVGIDGLSINLPVYFTIEEIMQISKLVSNHGKELFVSLNKNIHNSEIKKLEDTMLFLNDININGVLFYDIAVVELKDKLKLNYDLVWAQEHLTTNYSTINYWQEHGANYTLVSSEITLEEIIDIKENTDVKLIVPVFGNLPMFTSIRPVISNYLSHFNLTDNSKKNYIYKENNTYPIIQSNNGTTIYSSHLLNGIEESVGLKNNELDYLLVNSFNINDDDLLLVINSFKVIDESNVKEISSKVNNHFKDSYDKGFLYKETVYKVKNNE